MTARDAFFSDDGLYAEIGERKWILGLIVAVAFSPGLFAEPDEIRIPIWILHLGMGIIYFLAAWCIGHYRRAVFDGTTGQFDFREGFFLPYRRRAGKLREIERIRLYNRGSIPTLSFQHQGREFRMAAGGAGATTSNATLLARLAGCPLELN